MRDPVREIPRPFSASSGFPQRTLRFKILLDDLATPQNPIFLTYSAIACWTDNYALGMLTANSGR
jgi:hypothetical protein